MSWFNRQGASMSNFRGRFGIPPPGRIENTRPQGSIRASTSQPREQQGPVSGTMVDLKGTKFGPRANPRTATITPSGGIRTGHGTSGYAHVDTGSGPQPINRTPQRTPSASKPMPSAVPETSSLIERAPERRATSPALASAFAKQGIGLTEQEMSAINDPGEGGFGQFLQKYISRARPGEARDVSGNLPSWVTLGEGADRRKAGAAWQKYLQENRPSGRPAPFRAQGTPGAATSPFERSEEDRRREQTQGIVRNLLSQWTKNPRYGFSGGNKFKGLGV